MDTRTARLPMDLIDAAEAEGRESHRSTAKQLEHWARLGMFFDRQTSTSGRRIRRAVAGDLHLNELTIDEQLVANATFDARIASAAASTSFADCLAARGVTTVTMHDEGRMVRRHPDGSTEVV